MASNGVILLNLSNRNAADFQRLEVPDSYEKASGALTAGTYVTVYKWLYQGFMLAPSLCDAVDATDHINLVDRINGGIISVYPDDTITVDGGSPGRVPVVEPLQVNANGIYTPSAGVDGFSPVSVAVPSQSEPNVVPINIVDNGTYTAYGEYDGFSPITVNVQTRDPWEGKAVHLYNKQGQLGWYVQNGTFEIVNNVPVFTPVQAEVVFSKDSLAAAGGLLVIPGLIAISTYGSSGECTVYTIDYVLTHSENTGYPNMNPGQTFGMVYDSGTHYYGEYFFHASSTT